MRDLLKTLLTPNELFELLALSQQSLHCRTYADLKELVLSLRRLFAFENAICGFGNFATYGTHPDPNIDICNINYPENYLEEYLARQYHLHDPVLLELLDSGRVVNWGEMDRKAGFNMAQQFSAENGMRDGWAHGVIEPRTMDCVAFFWGGPYAENNPRTRAIIDYIVPFLTLGYKQVLQKPLLTPVRLTPKEKEVLLWLKEGKTSWEISRIFNCSKRVIDFHVTNLKHKLNATSRTQAVANAIAQGLVGF